MLKTQEDLFHEFFIFSLFVTVNTMSCISELGCHVDSPDTRQDCHIDNHGQFISQLAIWQRFDSWNQQKNCK